MTSDRALTWLAAVVSACVLAASGYLLYSSPERPWPYLLAILVLVVAWTLRHFASGERTARMSRPARSMFTQAIATAGVLLAIALGGVLVARLGWTLPW